MKLSNEAWLLICLIWFVICVRNFCIIGWDPANPCWFLVFLAMAITAAACGIYIWGYFYDLGLQIGRRRRHG